MSSPVFDRITGKRIVSKAQERANATAASQQTGTTVVRVTRLQQLASTAIYHRDSNVRAQAREEIDRVLSTRRAAPAPSSAPQPPPPASAALDVATIGSVMQQSAPPSQNVTSRHSATGDSQQVTIQRANNAPEQASYQSSGVTSQIPGQHTVSVSRAIQAPHTGREFTSSGVEQRPDGSLSVTVQPRR